MPMLKAISGHTSVKGIRRYLTKKNRALAEDHINLDPPAPGAALDWAAAMDATRRLYGNDSAWRGRRARTYKHYVVSPDPKDRVSLEGLRALAAEWAHESFPNHEVAIVYHDDNANGIPHAHVVVNNTDLETGRRLQDPDPKALARSLQRIAGDLGMSALEPRAPSGVAARAQRRHGRPAPKTLRDEHVRRVEKELAGRGEYSWVADIRARVRVARSVSRSVGEFKSLLSSMGVEVSDNSPKAERRDWVYSLAETPSRKVGGERLGLSYSRGRLEPMLRAGGRIDVFDTDHLVDGIPQPGNLLTNYTLDLSDLAGDSLWLRSYYHEAADAYREEPGPAGLPVARRRDGWSFLIADSDDLERLNRLTVDGETVLIRIAGELIDAASLSWACDAVGEYPSMAISALRSPSIVSCGDVMEAADAMGVPSSVIEAISAQMPDEAPAEPRF